MVALGALTLAASGCAAFEEPALSRDDPAHPAAPRAGAAEGLHLLDARVRALLSTTLTADAAVEVAALQNPRLEAAREELGAAEADLVQAGLLRNPRIDVELRLPVGGGGFGAHLGIEQSIASLFFRPLRRRLAGAALEEARLRVAGAVVDLAAETRSAFYEVAAAEEQRGLRETVLAATEASCDLARRIHEAGNMTDLDLALERAQLEDARLDLSQAELAATLARARLDGLLGVSGAGTSWRLDPRLPDLPAEETDLLDLERRAIERSLDLGVIRQRILAAGERAQQGRAAALLSDVDLGAESEREPEGTWTVGPSLSIPLPIFDQGQAVEAGLLARLRQARALRTAVAVEVRAGVRAARARVVAARGRVLRLRDVVLPLHEIVTSETMLQYNAMQVGAFRLLDARRRQVEAGARTVRELREYWLARTALERIVNGRLGSSGAAEMSGMNEPGAKAGASEGGH